MGKGGIMKYIRTKDGIWKYNSKDNSAERPNKEFKCNQVWLNIKDIDIEESADTIEELCDEFVFIESGSINTVSCLAEAKDRLLEYREHNNNESRLIGRIQVGLDTKAVAEFEELKEGKYKGCYDWILL